VSCDQRERKREGDGVGVNVRGRWREGGFYVIEKVDENETRRKSVLAIDRLICENDTHELMKNTIKGPRERDEE